MDNKTTNRLNMIRTTCLFCTNNTAATAGIANFAPTLLVVKNKVILVDQLDQIAGGTTTGVTLDTNLLRSTMSDMSFKIGSALVAYAASVNNATLKAKVDKSRSEYDRLKKDEVDDYCQTVHDEGNTNIVAAGPFGYIAADVTALQTAIDLYRAGSQNPRQAQIAITSALSQISNIIRDITNNNLHNSMDKMTNTLKLSNPVFVKEYFQAREIIDLGSTTGKVRGIVQDESENPLVGVTFIIFKTGTPTEVAKTNTGSDGRFNAANLPPGDYDFRWELIGYNTINEINVHLSAGHELIRNITLIKA